MTTFAQATLALADVLGEIYKGEADSGSSSSQLVDAALKARQGTLAHGTLWMLSGSNSGVVVEVDKHAQNTLYFAAMPAAIAAGDDYAVFEGIRFQKNHLEKAINLALEDLKQFTQWDETTTTVALQEEYTLPTGVSNVVSVEIAQSLTSPYLYAEHRGFMETAGGKLRFVHHEPSLAGYKIRIGYNTTHPELSSLSDTIKPGINLQRLKWEAAVHAWRNYLVHIEDPAADKISEQAANDAAARAMIAESHNILRLQKLPMLAGW